MIRSLGRHGIPSRYVTDIDFLAKFSRYTKGSAAWPGPVHPTALSFLLQLAEQEGLGAAIAVAIATLFWLVGCAVVLGRLSGLRTDALYLIGRLAALRFGAGLGGDGRVELERARPIDLLLGLLGRKQSREQQPRNERSDREKRYSGENLAEMERH